MGMLNKQSSIGDHDLLLLVSRKSCGTRMVGSPGGALIYISRGDRIVPDREHVPGFPISQVPKFP